METIADIVNNIAAKLISIIAHEQLPCTF